MTEGNIIAVVDDNQLFSRSVAKVLSSRQLSVEVFDTGKGFLGQIGRIDDFGCILLDLKMPEVGGLEILSALQDLAAPPSVLILTGHGDVPAAVEAMKMGAVDFMQKPFPSETLFDAVDRAITATRASRAARPLSHDGSPAPKPS